ncbi:hypothetical protein [Streptomyces sp. NPDC026659]|uniref:hypothetical protein n=1 Tax=Streptomyces sp. NPDC026659 TaxID=3155123 RepID=UPI00340D9988
MHRTARALTAATALVITGPTAAFASGWGADAPAARADAPAARAVAVAAACDAPAVPRAEIPEDVPGDIPDDALGGAPEDGAGGGDCEGASDVPDASGVPDAVDQQVAPGVPDRARDTPGADSGTGSGAGAGRSQVPGTGVGRSPAPGKAAPGTGQTPGRDSGGDTGDRPDSGDGTGTGSGTGDRPGTGTGSGTGDHPGTGHDTGDRPPTVQHGVDAGTGGSLTGSVPLLTAGAALIAAACAAALHRIGVPYPHRRRRRASDV